MKKLKLSLSICMMCLCVAVLCMGILAAGSATYQINGNISYNMIDGVARINTRVYKVAGDPASESDLQTAVTGTFLTTSSFAEIEANQSPIYAQTYQNKETLEYTDTPTTKDYDINVVYGANNDADAYYTYYVVIQIYNQTETSGYVLNASITKTDGTEIVSTDSSYVATNTSVSNIAQDTFSNIVIGISAQTIAKAQALTNSTETFAYKLSVTYEERVQHAFNELLATYTDSYDGSYWGVPLGRNADDGTPLIWRYVGDYSTSSDGTETFTRYETYQATKPTVGGGSVFVQNSSLGGNTIEWGSGDDSCNYFTESTLRTDIKDGGLFNLTKEEKEYIDNGCIEARTLPDIIWSCINDEDRVLYPYSDDSHYPLTDTSKGKDYFWLMSITELFDYFTGPITSLDEPREHTRPEFGYGWDYFWLRTPSYTFDTYGDEWDIVTFCNDEAFDSDHASTGLACRAAFRLA